MCPMSHEHKGEGKVVYPIILEHHQERMTAEELTVLPLPGFTSGTNRRYLAQ
jgi:hypothetical protein